MQDQSDHRVLLLEQQEVLMLGLGGRLTAPRRLSSRDDDQSAATVRGKIWTSCRLPVSDEIIYLLYRHQSQRSQPDYINDPIISGFRSKTYSSKINKIKTALRTSCLAELSFHLNCKYF